MNGSDAVVGVVEEATQAHPELTGMANGATVPMVGDGRTITGLSYKTLVRSALPSAPFRSANEGATRTESKWINKQFETYILNPRYDVDKAIADRHEDGWAALLALEGAGMLEAAMQTAQRCFYYGTEVANGADGDAKGFPGLLQMYDSASMEVDAGGTTDDEASSVWAVRFGPRNVQWIFGNNGAIELSDVRIGDVDDANGNPYTAYIQEILAYVGLQSTSKWSIGRIKKLTTDDGKGLTDDLLASLFETFKPGRPPHAFFMSKRSRTQLKNSRTATNPNGTPAPLPTDHEGIPIIVTEAISETEKLAL